MNQPFDSVRFLQSATEHLTQSLAQLPIAIGENFELALQLIEQTQGHFICSGMGKSGLIAKKMAATFASTGTPSFFLHPAEALHGDLGMITSEDNLLLISNSGESHEICAILPSIQAFGNKIIALTNRVNSTLGKAADIILPIAFDRELCPHNLAPITSTMITLVIGDLLSVALMERSQFSAEDFARFHPGGSLGRKLLMRVKDGMRKKPLPIVDSDTQLQIGMLTMTETRFGILLVYEGKNFLGIITDGDVRRALVKDKRALERPCKDYVNSSPITTHQNNSIGFAEKQLMEQKINALLVVNDDDHIIGIYEFHH